MDKRMIALLTGALALGSVGPGMTQEQPKATGIVAVRQMTMKANGDHMGAIKAILTEQPQLVKRVAWHAEAITEGVEYVPELFPEGSDQPPTAALPAVWKDQKGFKAAAAKAENLAKKLAETAKGGDVQATLAAFAALGKEGCGGCHETFRKKPQS
ncbi:c-type cytochrome [Benzoatithermus flavus]|uniref:Cytochrome c n=1 Tax=Benzoatithermus flavus TaxID=3108223 RepID=A0ABU8XVG8_9PROT